MSEQPEKIEDAAARAERFLRLDDIWQEDPRAVVRDLLAKLEAAEQERATKDRFIEELETVARGANLRAEAAEQENTRLQREADLYENAQCVTCAKHLDAALTPLSREDR